MEKPVSKFNIQEYIQIFYRRKWFFIIPLFLIYIGFFVSGYFLPKAYQAQAIILVEEKKVVNPLLKNLAVSTTVAQRITTLKEEMLAWPRVYQLVERLSLNKNIKTPIELERLIFDIRRNISLSMRSGEVVTVAYQSEDARGTQKLVNTLCDILIERNLSLQNEDTESAIDFINKQLAIYKGKLEKSEENLRQFKEIYGLDVLPQLKQSRIEPKEDSSAGSTAPLDSAGFTAPLVRISSELADLEAELVMASVDCTDEHPRVKDIKRRIIALKDKRDKYIEDAAKRTGVNPDLYVDIAGSLPRQQEELTHLTRDKAIDEKIYSMLLERLESAKITARLDSSSSRTTFRIIEPARLPLAPFKPNKLKLNFLGLILGAMVGFGFIYLAEYVDSSFKNADELKDSFASPVLGTISKITTEEDIENKRKYANRMFIVIGSLAVFVIVATVIIIKFSSKFLMFTT